MSRSGNRHPSQNDPGAFAKAVALRLFFAAVLVILFFAFAVPWLRAKGLA